MYFWKEIVFLRMFIYYARAINVSIWILLAVFLFVVF